MCRYSQFPVKSHFTCFKHRISMKRPRHTKPKCPTCQQFMTDMGRDFKPPKKTDDKGWAYVGRRTGDGMIPLVFDSCGC
jgi:hypothetical protein